MLDIYGFEGVDAKLRNYSRKTRIIILGEEPTKLSLLGKVSKIKKMASQETLEA